MEKGDKIDSGEEGVKETKGKHQWDPTTCVFKCPCVLWDLVLLNLPARQKMHLTRLVFLSAATPSCFNDPIHDFYIPDNHRFLPHALIHQQHRPIVHLQG